MKAQPLANSPCQFPSTYLESLFCVVLSCPPWSQVARELTSPSLPSLPIPNSQHPRLIVRLLRRHRDPGFTWSGTPSTGVRKLSYSPAIVPGTGVRHSPSITPSAGVRKLTYSPTIVPGAGVRHSPTLLK